MKKTFLIAISIFFLFSCKLSKINKSGKGDSDRLFKISQNGKYGYIDKTGKIIIVPQFDGADDFFEGLAGIKSGSDLGYIDKTGAMVIKGKFTVIRGFSEGFALVKTDSTLAYIDKTGKIVIRTQLYEVFNFSNGLARVKSAYQSYDTAKTDYKGYHYYHTYGINEGKWGYLDNTGKMVIKPQFDEANGFNEGFAWVKSNGKYGYINKIGTIVIKPQFDIASNFFEGLAAVKIGTKWGYINKTGELVIKAQFDGCNNFKEGLAPVLIGNKIGYINKGGQTIIDLRFYMGQNFSEGLAPVQEKDKGNWGYIDKTGKYIIQAQFDSASDFNGELAWVKVKKGDSIKHCYIDKTGNSVWCSSYTLERPDLPFWKKFVANNNPSSEDRVFTVVEQMPIFPGDIDKWLNEHLVYPKQAKDMNIQGIVYVSYVVEDDGAITTVKLLKGVNSYLDDEAIRVVSTMPAFSPGMQNKHVVRVRCVVPVKFVLPQK